MKNCINMIWEPRTTGVARIAGKTGDRGATCNFVFKM